MSEDTPQLQIGWATADLTPSEPVLVTGQFHARVSESVLDPVTCTALALSAGEGDSAQAAVLVSCDFVAIPENLLKAVRALVVKKKLAGLDAKNVFLNATHTHTAPEIRVDTDALQFGGGNVPARFGVDLPPVMPAEKYVAFVAPLIAKAVAKAWRSRKPGSIGFGLGQAVVGHNRRISYYGGESRMYGKVNDPNFSHVEGYEDHFVNILGTWNEKDKLTGLVVNVPCPSQVSEHLFQVSADYWHDTRVELRRRLGKRLFVLGQCSAAGDQAPRPHFVKAAEERMERLSGRNRRQQIAARIADTVTANLPFIKLERTDAPRFAHAVATVELSRRRLCQKDVDDALAEANSLRSKYEALKQELDAHPELKQKPRWYVDITALYRRIRWNEKVQDRFELEKTQPKVPVEIHVLRLGDMAIATNPFEYYLDYGVQIKARSPAVQTFVVQLAGSGTYLPTERAIAGKSYGAVPASTPVGPEGGREIVEKTLQMIEELWAEKN